MPVRRYLTDFDTARAGHIITDVLVVGAGVAGLTAARHAARHGDVIILAKGDATGSNTHWAQGGVAAVMSPIDSIEQHVADTLRVGAGLNRRAAVDLTCQEGPARIRELLAGGLDFDRENGDLAFGLEGGHRGNRVLHAGGDATGKAMSEHLTAAVRASEHIRLFTQCFLIDFLTVDGACVGAVTYHPKYGHQLIWAAQTILASGGFGQLYRETSNPPGITGDGVAAAFRAGALIADMEMIQFHPTTLYIAGSTRALVSEAVRGEGAHLVDRNGRRFMTEYHPDGELAPRDVVSRAIVDQLRKSHATSVYLDVRHLGAEAFAGRFPTVTARCAEFGIDVRKDLIPVRPAAHFSIGGVVADLAAQTTVPGLLCCGEASCTGLHGANRLASNSLLEGLVFGRIAGERAGETAARTGARPAHRMRQVNVPSPKTRLDLADVRQSLRSLMWRNAGIVRNGDRLAETVEIIDFWSKFTLDKTFDEPAGWEVQNLLMLGRLLAASALARNESRGVHFREDVPEAAPDPARHHGRQMIEGHCIEHDLDLDFQPL